MATERKPKPKNNGQVMTFLTLYCLFKYAMANGRARVTAALMFCNVLTYFRKPGLIINAILPTIDQVWFNSYRFLEHKEQKRFYLSPFYHFRQNHLVYDMLKLLWNGVDLEPKMGGLEYATMFGFLLFISQSINFLGRYLALLAGKKMIYEDEKVVGCTNVMFALDYIRNALAEGERYMLGYRVPRDLSPWIDLIVARIVGAGDFLGNLGGVLTGVLYLQLNSSERGPDPIAEMIRKVFGLRRGEDIFQDEIDRKFERLRRLQEEMEIEQAAIRRRRLRRQDRPRFELQLSDIDEEEIVEDEH